MTPENSGKLFSTPFHFPKCHLWGRGKFHMLKAILCDSLLQRFLYLNPFATKSNFYFYYGDPKRLNLRGFLFILLRSCHALEETQMFTKGYLLHALSKNIYYHIKYPNKPKRLFVFIVKYKPLRCSAQIFTHLEKQTYFVLL